MTDYRNARARARRLSADIEALLKRNSDLEEANRKLRAAQETFITREEARERVLKGLTNEIPISG